MTIDFFILSPSAVFPAVSRRSARRRPEGCERQVFVIRNGLQWKDAPAGYSPHKTLYSRFIRWSQLGVFDRIFAALAGDRECPRMGFR